ncbi:hypothetical protein WJX77_005541 [Trebouxia sp. C0004]
MSVPRGPVYADQGLTLCCSCCYLSTHWQHQQLHRRLCAVPDKDQHDLLQVVNGIHLTAQALALSLGLSMDGLLHVTVASIKSLENPGKHHGSNTGQRLSMATAVITAMRHKKSLPANTSFFQKQLAWRNCSSATETVNGPLEALAAEFSVLLLPEVSCLWQIHCQGTHLCGNDNSTAEDALL